MKFKRKWIIKYHKSNRQMYDIMTLQENVITNWYLTVFKMFANELSRSRSCDICTFVSFYVTFVTLWVSVKDTSMPAQGISKFLPIFCADLASLFLWNWWVLDCSRCFFSNKHKDGVTSLVQGIDFIRSYLMQCNETFIDFSFSNWNWRQPEKCAWIRGCEFPFKTYPASGLMCPSGWWLRFVFLKKKYVPVHSNLGTHTKFLWRNTDLCYITWRLNLTSNVSATNFSNLRLHKTLGFHCNWKIHKPDSAHINKLTISKLNMCMA